MYADLLSSDNYINMNIKTAQVFGINTAVYWAELLNIILKVVKKKKLDNEGFFTLDRDYISKRTTLTLEDQYICDSNLTKAGIIEISPENKNMIKTHVDLMVSIITSEDTKLLNNVAKTAKTKRTAVASAKSEAIKATMKSIIIEPDTDLLNALRDWVDSIYANKNFLTKKVIEVFQDTIRQYTSSKAAQLKIIEIATIHAYKDAAWAISVYEKDYKKSGPLISEQKVATVVDTTISF